MAKKTINPIHPGEILLEEFLRPFDLSQNQLARDLDVPATRINEVVNGVRPITIDTAMRLGRYFGTTPEFWLNLQQRHDLLNAQVTIGPLLERRITPREELAS